MTENNYFYNRNQRKFIYLFYWEKYAIIIKSMEILNDFFSSFSFRDEYLKMEPIWEHGNGLRVIWKLTGDLQAKSWLIFQLDQASESAIRATRSISNTKMMKALRFFRLLTDEIIENARKKWFPKEYQGKELLTIINILCLTPALNQDGSIRWNKRPSTECWVSTI